MEAKEVSGWTRRTDGLPQIGDIIVAIRTEYPKSYFLGKYTGQMVDPEDSFHWWIKAPKEVADDCEFDESKCHWCDKETNNPPDVILNGKMEEVVVSFCDTCKKARQSNEKEPNGN